MFFSAAIFVLLLFCFVACLLVVVLCMFFCVCVCALCIFCVCVCTLNSCLFSFAFFILLSCCWGFYSTSAFVSYVRSVLLRLCSYMYFFHLIRLTTHEARAVTSWPNRCIRSGYRHRTMFWQLPAWILTHVPCPKTHSPFFEDRAFAMLLTLHCLCSCYNKFHKAHKIKKTDKQSIATSTTELNRSCKT